jgi:hypothetical protein
VAAGGTRPDLIIQRTGAAPDCVVVELKATRSPSYLGEGLSQLLGYLHDRPEQLGPAPAGWVVAPASESFQSAAAGEGALWVLDAGAVGRAATDRFVSSAS